MVIEEIKNKAIHPALSMLPDRMASREAELMLLAIGLQESGLIHRKQIGGPAKGLFQFEAGGGVRGVLMHPSSRQYAIAVCWLRDVKPSVDSAYDALERDDVLAAAFARLLLWTDREPLPRLGEPDEAWDYYLRTWRPGKPRRDRWDACYARAIEFLGDQY